MPYTLEARELARETVQQIRKETVCARCKKQPIEWHRKEHEQNSNLRIAHLVALGFPLEVIRNEIARCEPLCRSCHMKHDGRLVELRKNCPNQLGTVLVGPVICICCGILTRPSWAKKCRRCYDKIRRQK